ncbi:MAG: serine hydrolase, partial [Acetobacteraceae bacterium]|nr:serine hydrolase [Acetobacteraceae bacterium]
MRVMLAAFLLLTLAPALADVQDPFRQKVTEALPRLEEMAQASIRAGEVPGLAIAVVLQDKVIYLKGFGSREVGKNAAVSPDTVFQLASCSKPISGTVVAALVSDGAVGWDTRIADADPGFRLHDAYPTVEVTIRDLFAHRSGLPGDAGNDLEELGFSRDEILRRVRNLEPSSSFRAGYAYSNFGLTEGAVAAARAAGLSWEDAADIKLFKPLGMVSTSARYADFIRQNDRAALHIRRDGRWQALLTRDADAQSPAGGISSTARDLTRWVRLELGNGTFEGRELIKAAAIDPTHTPVIMRG